MCRLTTLRIFLRGQQLATGTFHQRFHNCFPCLKKFQFGNATVIACRQTQININFRQCICCRGTELGCSFEGSSQGKGLHNILYLLKGATHGFACLHIYVTFRKLSCEHRQMLLHLSLHLKHALSLPSSRMKHSVPISVSRHPSLSC